MSTDDIPLRILRPADPERNLSADPQPPYSSVVHESCEDFPRPLPQIRVNRIPGRRSPNEQRFSNRILPGFRHFVVPPSVIDVPETPANNETCSSSGCVSENLCSVAVLILIIEMVVVLDRYVFNKSK